MRYPRQDSFGFVGKYSLELFVFVRLMPRSLRWVWETELRSFRTRAVSYSTSSYSTLIGWKRPISFSLEPSSSLRREFTTGIFFATVLRFLTMNNASNSIWPWKKKKQQQQQQHALIKTSRNKSVLERTTLSNVIWIWRIPKWHKWETNKRITIFWK